LGLDSLIIKYSTPGPRYTSYPTAPQWSDAIGESDYRQALARVRPGEALSLYVHLPFCEKLCYYCGCNIQITGDKTRSRPYVQQVKNEIAAVAAALGGRRRLTQISWGGGTPTFLTLSEIEDLHGATRAHFDLDGDAEINIEIDPRVTSNEQLALLRRLGFNRTSLGVQDFNPQVQEAINRIQPASITAALLEECRRLGFDGINFDLIYGLPWQSLASFESTVDQVIAMGPDRIALYNYARLPSLLKHQVILEKFPMPSAEERVAIFTMALERLTAAGYVTIGMDHFAKKTDSLARSLERGTLYRNFMGYTVREGAHLLGVGTSAIGEVGGGFFQNVRKASDYEAVIASGKLATMRGLVLTDDDQRRKWVIQSLMCRFELSAEAFRRELGGDLEALFADELSGLDRFRHDGILEGSGGLWKVTERGRLFVRNVAMVFDAYLQNQKATFSKTV
jgi:oxygen-independent coproporphyrinogen III oxidase